MQSDESFRLLLISMVLLLAGCILWAGHAIAAANLAPDNVSTSEMSGQIYWALYNHSCFTYLKFSKWFCFVLSGVFLYATFNGVNSPAEETAEPADSMEQG